MLLLLACESCDSLPICLLVSQHINKGCDNDNAYHLSVYECVSISLERAVYSSVTQYYVLYPNCTIVFEGLDINADEYMDPHVFVAPVLAVNFA